MLKLLRFVGVFTACVVLAGASLSYAGIKKELSPVHEKRKQLREKRKKVYGPKKVKSAETSEVGATDVSRNTQISGGAVVNSVKE